jgi:hypothetical protein
MSKKDDDGEHGARVFVGCITMIVMLCAAVAAITATIRFVWWCLT